MVTQDAIILAATAAVSAAVTALYVNKRMRKKVAYMLDALEDKELNFHFDEKKLLSRKFNCTLNRIRRIFDKERNEIMEQERYYGSMLDHVRTGIAVIGTSGKNSRGRRIPAMEGSVRYCNATALELLGISSLSNIRQLQNISPSLYDAFRKVTENHDERAGWYNESGRRTIAITASAATIRGNEVKIVTFNDISDEIEENEQASWTRLIRVLTHEIMNTVTPIASLSNTLSKYLAENPVPDTEIDLKAGLDTICKSSEGIIKFVQSYRDLTKIATPVKRAFPVKEMIENVFRLTENQAEEAGAELSFTEMSGEVLLYADENQISQIIVNLIKNAIQAGASAISVTAEIDSSDSTIIRVANNGVPISKESREQIFVPFFTTKQDGTGIGLSISKQIMRLHNGSIALASSDADSTVFAMVFK